MLSPMHWTHNLDPVIFSIGSFEIRWYGLMYVVGFLLGSYLAKRLVDRNFFKVPKAKLDTLATMLFIGMFVCARVAYVFIYNWDYYSQNIGHIFFQRGGLSFHGAVIGLILAAYIFSKLNKISFWQTMDVVCLVGAPGLFFGRLGNFINGELYGRRTDLWMGMIFPNGGPYPRHPSQLYEAALEGLAMSLVLWFLVKKVRHYGIISCTSLVFYGVARFMVEFLREPDDQLGYYFGWMTMGQILCALMLLASVPLYLHVRRARLEV